MAELKYHTVAKVNTIPDGAGEAYPIDGRMVAVFNEGGTFQAIDDLCPHMGASLAAGYLEDGVVSCPWHAWRFKTCDGTWCDNPTIKIDSFPVRIVGDEIQVAIPPKEDTPADEMPSEKNDQLPNEEREE
ncbi:MAG: Rieske (2Fe-2S) protein [Planctomycetaceae bacterium]|nr:Rieske (2Fe-2S) protein [Planctomycetaceae bacterium]